MQESVGGRAGRIKKLRGLHVAYATLHPLIVGPPSFRRVAVLAASLQPRALGGSAEESPRCCACRLAAASGGSAEVSPGRSPCRLAASRANVDDDD